MLIALAFCDKDYLLAEKLFRWMAELDGVQRNHDILLMASGGMAENRRKLVQDAAGAAFSVVFNRKRVQPDERGWPLSCNSLFLTTYREAVRLGVKSFFWIEPDCTPLRPGWLDEFEAEYASAGKPFMGCVYELPFRHLTGCAIYPADLDRLNPPVVRPNTKPWDLVNPGATLRHTHHTNNFQHVWGNFTFNIAPSFPNQASLRLLRAGALLFHRCKDGSLIDRLRERLQFPRLCKFMARFQNPSNRFQDFEDSIFPMGAT